MDAPPKILPPHYWVASLLLMLLLSLIGDPLLPQPFPWFGVLPLVAGIVIALVASRQFSKVGTNIVPLTDSSHFVTDGMFKLSRNPMYLGMVLALIGVALLLNRILPWLVLPVFLFVIQFLFIAREEVKMHQQFGKPYLAYKDQVRRWF